MAPDEHTIARLAAELKLAGIERHLIVEADEPYAGQAMAIGIEPTDKRRLKKILGRLSLMK